LLHQKDFINEIIAPMNWLLTFNMSAADFITHIGLTSPIDEWKNYAANRSALVYAVNCITGIIRRVDRKLAMLPEILPYVCAMSKLITNLNEMWRSDLQALCNKQSREIIYAPLLETERMSLLESPFGPTSQSHSADLNEPKHVANRMQTFLWILQENCYNAIGCSASNLKPEIYENMDFTTALHHIDLVPDFRLKMMMKNFLKPLILNCAKTERYYEMRIFPMVSKLLPYLFQRYDEKWDEIKNKRFSTEKEQKEGTPEQMDAELLEEQIVRYVSKEFVEILGLLMLEKSLVQKAGDSKRIEETECLSKLGEFLLQKVPEVLPITFKVITWLDSNISIRATNLATIIIQKLLAAKTLPSPSDSCFLFTQITSALGYFGEHDQNQALLLQLFISLYEGMYQQPNFDAVRSNLAQFCGGNVRNWLSFEQNSLKLTASGDTIYKRKKDSLKRLLDNVIGVGLMLLFTKNMFVKLIN
jgi:hypothetical protein